MKVTVFENEYESIRAAFEAVSLINFSNTLQVHNYVSSQSCEDFNSLLDSRFIFVDIDLSAKSLLDGFEVIKQLIDLGYNKENILILTGHNNITEKAKEKGLADLVIVTKPVVFTKLYEAMSRRIQ